MSRSAESLAKLRVRSAAIAVRWLVISLSVVACSAIAAQAQPVKVADEHPLYLETPDGDVLLSGEAWTATIEHPGASYIALHFSGFNLADGDALIVSDADGGQQYSMRGRGKMEAGTFWARHVKGDTVVLRLLVGGDGNARFDLDRYAAGHPQLDFGPPPPRTEAICGLDDKQNAICFRDSHPAEYAAARPVARLFINGTNLCTGWLASDENHLITNQHCIGSAASAIDTDFEFMAEAPSCGSGNCQLCHPGDVYSGATLLKTDANLDYTLVQITTGDPAALYGFLEIEPRDAVPGEEIFIPQHPGGRAKELGLFSTTAGDGPRCKVINTTEPPCTGAGYQDVGYFCDTEGGSSGSPVLSVSDQRVIALHHCANCENRAVPIDLVWAQIKDLLPGSGDAFRLLTPANGASVTSSPDLGWSRGDNELFLVLSLLSYEGLGYQLFSAWSLGEGYTLPDPVFEQLTRGVPSFWIVLGIDTDDWSWTRSELWSFTPEEGTSESAVLYGPQLVACDGDEAGIATVSEFEDGGLEVAVEMYSGTPNSNLTAYWNCSNSARQCHSRGCGYIELGEVATDASGVGSLITRLPGGNPFPGFNMHIDITQPVFTAQFDTIFSSLSGAPASEDRGVDATDEN